MTITRGLKAIQDPQVTSMGTNCYASYLSTKPHTHFPPVSNGVLLIDGQVICAAGITSRKKDFFALPDCLPETSITATAALAYTRLCRES